MSENETIGEVQPIDTNVGVVGYVALKTIGVAYFVNGLKTFAEMMALVGDPGWRGLFSSYFVRWASPPAVELVAGALLMVFARPICRRVFRVRQGVRIGGDATRIVTLISVGIGFYWLVSGVTLGGMTIAAEIVRYRAQHAVPALQAKTLPEIEQIRDIFRPILDLVLGAFLFFRPSWIVGQWKKRVQLPVAE